MAMATQIQDPDAVVVELLTRVINPTVGDLPVEAAEAFLRMQLEQHDRDRIHELLVKNNAGTLRPGEWERLESFLSVSALLRLMHAKARLSLAAARSGS
jgi:hypothetical protein